MEKLQKSKDVAADKLIILYIMRKLGVPASNIRLTAYVLEQRLMDYFAFQQHVNELTDAGYIAEVRDESGGGRRLYALADSGAELLDGLLGLAPQAEKNRIDRTISSLKGKAKDERAVAAGYTPLDENRQNVSLVFLEGDSAVMKIELRTASNDDARRICANWKSRTQEIYAKLVDELLRG
ncbi:MAG: DUF4364 family protein [Clostridiales bacterium]|jgi:DNA-binding MarR family transcriptional regulator|nr:DUF4364 family protein [Clostridiales bacterium]